MFLVYFTNHQYFSQREFRTADEALAFGKSTTFDFQLHQQVGERKLGLTKLLCTWSYFGGLRAA